MARTETLPGMETPKHQELCSQARIYADVRDKWLALQRQFKTEKDKLLTLMKDAELRIYHDAEEALHIEVKEKENVTVKYGDGDERDNGE